MRMFVWENVDNVTTNWHNGGGLMVIARDINHARELIEAELPKACEALTKDPDMVYHVEDALSLDELEAKVVLFPDSGCC